MSEAVGLDTSVVLRLLVGEPAVQAAKALEFVKEAQVAGKPMEISDLVIAETYFALQHHYGVAKKAALGALRKLSQSGDVVFTELAADILASVPNLENAKPGFVDRLIYAGYLTRGCQTFASFEKAASRLPGARVLG